LENLSLLLKCQRSKSISISNDKFDDATIKEEKKSKNPHKNKWQKCCLFSQIVASVYNPCTKKLPTQKNWKFRSDTERGKANMFLIGSNKHFPTDDCQQNNKKVRKIQEK
jgi:hypothetical protein